MFSKADMLKWNMERNHSDKWNHMSDLDDIHRLHTSNGRTPNLHIITDCWSVRQLRYLHYHFLFGRLNYRITVWFFNDCAQFAHFTSRSWFITRLILDQERVKRLSPRETSLAEDPIAVGHATISSWNWRDFCCGTTRQVKTIRVNCEDWKFECQLLELLIEW